jgi:hypothetical protein
MWSDRDRESKTDYLHMYQRHRKIFLPFVVPSSRLYAPECKPPLPRHHPRLLDPAMRPLTHQHS